MAVWPIRLRHLLFVAGIGTTALPASASAGQCDTQQPPLGETKLKLQLIDRGYSIINLNFNPVTGCYFLYGYNDKREKIYALFSASNGRLVQQSAAD
ncbi:hypothetical protein [Motiliproteus sediminis]|uniref:hypothetical protein n=1 Tax=Motiliproteus sediminis TaxID=1468178 RepID=UPI001AF00952|nr:hypothetical protein [Motiliproteus sediminis]